MDIGSIISSLRKKEGINQAKLAKMSGISQTYLSQIENNKKEPHLSSLKKISEALEVPLPVLLFLSMDEKDIPDKKKNAFRVLFPSIKAFMVEMFPKSANLTTG